MKKKMHYLLLVPCLVLLIVFLVMPLIQIILPTLFPEGSGFSFTNYLSFFQDEYYMTIFIRTVKIALISSLVCMILGVPTAYFISRCDKKWRGILMAISIFPMLTDSVVRTFDLFIWKTSYLLSLATISLKWRPLCSKLSYISQLAQAGDNRTVSPLSAI